MTAGSLQCKIKSITALAVLLTPGICVLSSPPFMCCCLMPTPLLLLQVSVQQQLEALFDLSLLCAPAHLTYVRVV